MQWEGSGFPYCKVRERAGGGERRCHKSSHIFSPTWHVQKGGKGLAEENPGQQDCEREAGVGVVISSHSFLNCSQAPKLPCVST